MGGKEEAPVYNVVVLIPNFSGLFEGFSVSGEGGEGVEG